MEKNKEIPIRLREYLEKYKPNSKLGKYTYQEGSLLKIMKRYEKDLKKKKKGMEE